MLPPPRAVALVVVVASRRPGPRSSKGGVPPGPPYQGRSLQQASKLHPSSRRVAGSSWGAEPPCDDCYKVFPEPKGHESVVLTVLLSKYTHFKYNESVTSIPKGQMLLNSGSPCLEYLIPADLHEEYQAHVQTVGK
ncbi:crustacean hyperglycemic hormones 5-like [Penaeus monodon]|uniref:crustacean hyperglycemic hormones 5-like n=1 Tax=Penaeus monodon TaxID=6687 RepID=UPI0018A746F9|nr:crustacean hyperglycemic hormones 5-like [Penaeus monodon]